MGSSGMRFEGMEEFKEALKEAVEAGFKNTEELPDILSNLTKVLVRNVIKKV